MTPLFIPLKSEYYEAFANASKTDELRLYGPRWNEHTCRIGREVVLSRGYGKKNRMRGVIWNFTKKHGTHFSSFETEAIKNCFGTLDVDIAVLSITDLKPIAI